MQVLRSPEVVKRQHWLLAGLALLLVVAGSLSLPKAARADVVIGGCTVVSNPTAAHFTNCPNANLTNADLSGGMNLSFANLSGATLSGADISDANLTEANLSGAIMNPTNVGPTDYSDAIMIRVNVSGVNFNGVNLNGANLSGANLTNVTWNSTRCPNDTFSQNHGNTCVGFMFLPIITPSATKADNTTYTAGSWSNQNVTVHFTCAAAATHTLANCTADQTFSTEGTFTKNGKATDNAPAPGPFFTEVSFGPIQIDKTLPTITASASKADNSAYAAGTWSNQNVTVHFTCSDSGSGIAGTCPADQIISSEGNTPPVNGAVSDNAGNSANVNFGPILVDKTKPTITGNRTPAANANGWNNSDVTVSFTCADNQGGSGLVTNTITGATLSTEGANQSVQNTGSCTDNAANSADPVTVTPINIDKSAPETAITGKPDDPSPLVAIFTLSGIDALAGVSSFQCSLDGAPFAACTSPQNYPTLSEGAHTFQVQAIDAAGNVDASPASYSWTASGDLPVAVDQMVMTDEEQSIAVTLQANGKNALSYSIVSNPAHGSLGGTPPKLIYTPTLNFNGVDSFTFRANDGQFNSNIATVMLHVMPVNDPPVIGQAPLAAIEDTPISVTLNVQDVDGDQLTFAVLSQPVHGSLHGALPNLTYTPAANFNGSDSFSFSVNDGSGAQASTAPATLITGTLQISVSAVNDAPVASDLTVTTPPDTPTVIVLTAVDVDGDLLTYSFDELLQHGTLSGVPPTLTYTPEAKFIGTDKLVFRASDGQVKSNAATITIRVTSQPFDFYLPLISRR